MPIDRATVAGLEHHQLPIVVVATVDGLHYQILVAIDQRTIHQRIHTVHICLGKCEGQPWFVGEGITESTGRK